MIHYDTTGHKAVQIAPDRRRPPFSGVYATPEEAQAAGLGYIAYFGTYSIDERAGAVTIIARATSIQGLAISCGDTSSWRMTGSR